MRRAVVLFSLTLWFGCATGGHESGAGREDGGGTDGSLRPLDATADRDAAGGDASAGRDAAAAHDSGAGGHHDAAAAADAGSGPGSGLDPLLRPADPSGTPCATPGSMAECPGIAVCRFYTSGEGRCESCDACGNLGDPCASGADCDILFACYAGRCTNICPLGTFYCGPVEDCLDVGHPTHGVCRP